MGVHRWVNTTSLLLHKAFDVDVGYANFLLSATQQDNLQC